MTLYVRRYPAGRLFLPLFFDLATLLASRSNPQRHPFALVFQTMLYASPVVHLVERFRLVENLLPLHQACDAAPARLEKFFSSVFYNMTS